MFFDIFSVNDYLKVESIEGGYPHGPEKSGETQKSKSQSKATGSLSQTEIVQEMGIVRRTS